MYGNAKIQFSQTTHGEHFIRDAKGNEIEIDTKKMTMDDIRSLLNGLGNLMTSLASSTWNKELVEKEQ